MDYLAVNQPIRIIPENVNGITDAVITSVNDDSFTAKFDDVVNNFILKGQIVEIILPNPKGIIKFHSEILEINHNNIVFSIPPVYKHIQRREYSRIDLNIPVKLKDPDNERAKFNSTTTNISGGGMQLKSIKDFASGTVLEAQFSIQENKEIKSLFEVLRNKEKNPDQKEYFLSGKFKKISNRDRTAIIQLCFKRQLELRCKGINNQ